MKTFIELLVDGEVEPEEIDDFIDEWHEGTSNDVPLHSFLGMAEIEYEAWLGHPGALDGIVRERKERLKV